MNLSRIWDSELISCGVITTDGAGLLVCGGSLGNLTQADIDAFGFTKGAFNSSANLTSRGFVPGAVTTMPISVLPVTYPSTIGVMALLTS